MRQKKRLIRRLAQYSIPLALLAVGPSRAAEPAPATGGPAPLADAAKRMTLPPGFTATLFAGEPDVVQPIAFTFDDRGRMWVVECRSYPNWIKDDKTPGNDSIVIFEDTDGDGKFDKRTVFASGLKNVSAIELGFGGVWIGAVPYLQFIPINPGEDKPAGPAQILLDGWNLNEVKHNIFSSFTWGPDGWLYATNGIQSKSKIGKPGTPDEQRVKFDCGVWRYHPTRHVFEVVAVGTTNPWGLDFDEYGQIFITNCVIAHLWHVIPGAYYQRMYGQHFNPYHYGYMQTCADHLHWETGKAWGESRAKNGVQASDKTNEAGGGHAHVGAMIYQGGDWPAEYRNTIFTCNLHGNRVNNDILEQKGSGYVGHHGKDFLMANDPWFRGLCIKQGPYGSAYISDWSDTGECHNYKEVDPSNGRIYKLTYGAPQPPLLKLQPEEPMSLVDIATRDDAWIRRHALRLLQERFQPGSRDANALLGPVTQYLHQAKDAKVRLRLVWVIASTAGLPDSLALHLLKDPEPYLRGWVIRLVTDTAQPPSPELLKEFAELAKSDPSPVVRLHLASALQRLSLINRWPIAEALVQHAEDATDANLPLMNWFAIEPLVPADTSRALALAEKSKLNIVNQYIARRAADGPSKAGIEAVVGLLGKSKDEELKKWLLIGIREGLNGLPKFDMPAGWSEVYPKLAASPRGEVRDGATELALIFGDQTAITTLRQQAADTKLEADVRGRAIRLLVSAKDPGLTELLSGLQDDPAVRIPVIRGLAAVGKKESASVILSRYAQFTDAEKSEALQALVSRPAYAVALLEAVASKKIPKTDLTVYTVRQIAGMSDTGVKQKLKEVWGDVRPPEKDKLARMASLKKELTAPDSPKGNADNGKLVFMKTCAACHTLFDVGGKVGPNLTGSQRANLDYVLENVIDPSAQVASEYRVTVVDTRDDRRIEGIIVAETDNSVTLRTTTEDISLQKSEIVKRKTSPLSMMPEGLFDGLTPQERKDLLAYLRK